MSDHLMKLVWEAFGRTAPAGTLGGASVNQPEPQREALPALSEAVTADIRHLVDQFSPNWAEFHSTVTPIARLELP